MITYEHLQELQRFAELGRMSASLLHEISNPLAAALLNLELSDGRSASVRRARRDVQLLCRYVDAARQQPRGQGRSVDFRIGPQCGQLAHVLLPLARKAGVRLDMDPPPDCRLHGDPVKFQHIISNLVVNAVEAYGPMHSSSHAAVVSVIMTHRDGQLTVQVADWGVGITSEDLPHVFETFYSTKSRAGHGLGLGLSIVKRYVTADFRGSLRVTSSLRNGTRFIVKLPTLA